jgi:hypothetical protein
VPTQAPAQTPIPAVQRSPESPAASGQASPPAERKSPRPVIQEQPLANQPAPRPPAVESSPLAPRLPSIEEVESTDRPLDDDATLIAPPAAVQRAPAADAPPATPDLPQPPTARLAARLAEDVAPALPPDVIAAPQEPESTSDLQPMSLEAAWPVQRLADESLSPAQASPAELPLPAPQAELAVSPQAHQVSSLLQQVEPGQPTDSAVEVVTPRRPRPSLLERPPSAVQKSSLDEASAPRQTASPGDTQLAGSDMVPTEIGPLPADLWQLIGQSPPAAPPVTPPAEPPSSVASASVPVVQLMPQSSARSEPASSQTAQAHSIQVQPAPAAVIPLSPSSDASPPAGVLQMAEDQAPAPAETSPAQPAEPAPEVDVDELTRRVYQEIKRRLSTEWERMRRKL